MAKRILILLVIDNQNVLNLFERALKAVGYDVAIADEAEDVERILKVSIPSLVLIAEKLQQVDGLTLAANLLERFPTLPIILYAQQENTPLLRNALKLGISDCLFPGLRTDDIVAVVQRSLARANATGDWVRREVRRTTASLEKRVDALELLIHLARDITGSLHLDQVLDNVVSAAVSLTAAEEGSLLLLDNDEHLFMRAGCHFTPEFIADFRIPVKGTLAGKVIETDAALLLNAAEYQVITPDYQVRSIIYAPLRREEKVIGVLGVDNRQKTAGFSEQHSSLISILAGYASIAIQNAKLFEKSETERQKFQATFSNIENGVIILDSKERILLINPAAQGIFELASQSCAGEALRDVIPHPDIDLLLKRTSETPLKYHEIHLDSGQTYSAQLAPIPGVGSAITMQDITYLKDIDRIKSEFVHTVSHDLRSPLTSILGYAELLERIGVLNEQQQQFVQRIQESVRSITALVNDLLDLGRLESGFDMRREITHIDGILTYTLDNLKSELAKKAINVHVDVDSEMPSLRGNPIRLRQMLDNLIGNAYKYTPENGTVAISLRAETDQIILQVKDTGPGIPRSDQPHIFEKFYRASNIPDGVGGSGLGLAIVKTIVDNHQGRIWVESTEGGGTTFTVVLPAGQPNAK